MKIKIHTLVLLSGLIIGAIIAPHKALAQDVSFQVFYDNLSPYGYWTNNPQYGYVWTPAVGADFVPYSSAGHWENTDMGWTWVSDYPWGWAAFHYGRWDFDPATGWFWVPGSEWAPAWVSWRRAPGYYGWAPLGPGINVSLAIGGGWNCPDDRWIFCGEGYMGRRDIYRYYSPRENNYNIVHRSSIINNTYVDNRTHRTYVYGPRRDEVQKVTHTEIHPREIHEVNKPGHDVVKNNTINIYRPTVSRASNNQVHPAPARVDNPKDIRRNVPPAQNPAAQQTRTPAPAVKRQDAPRDFYNPPGRNHGFNQTPEQRSAPAQQPRQNDQRPAPPAQQPSRPQEQPQPQRQMEQPRQAPPVQQPHMEQPRQAPPIQQPHMEQPRQAPPMQQPRMEQPRSAPPAPRMEAPHGGGRR